MSEPNSALVTACPFCRSQRVHTLSDGRLWFVLCEQCKARGPGAASDIEALMLWSEANHTRRLLRTVIDESPDVIAIKDADGRFLLVNEGLARLYQSTPEAMVGRSDMDFINDPEQAAFFQRSLQEVLRSGETQLVEEVVTDVASGRKMDLYAIKKPMRLGPEEKPALLVIGRDVTELKQAYREIEIREQRYGEAMWAAGEGIWDWDIAADLVTHNHKWCEILGLDDDALQHPVGFYASLVHPEDRDGVMAALQHSLVSGGEYGHEHRMICADGSEIWVYDRGRVTEWNNDGYPSRMVGSFADISARKRAEIELAATRAQLEEANAQLEFMVEERTAELVELNLELQSLARRDALTGLANRLAADEYITGEFARMKRSGRPYVIMFVDVDLFKQINDTHGHAVGDQVLKHLASLLRNNLRETDFVARFGGEEFLLALDMRDLAAARQLAEGIRRAVEVTPLAKNLSVTISVGLALASPDDADAAAALRRADDQLYRAKREGRNCVRAEA